MKFARTAFLLLGLLAIAHAQGQKGGKTGGSGGKTGGKGGGSKAGNKNAIAYGGHDCNLHDNQIDCENDTANLCYYRMGKNSGSGGSGGGGQVCCRALISSCQACQKGMTEAQFCAKRPTYTGCSAGGAGSGGKGGGKGGKTGGTGGKTGGSGGKTGGSGGKTGGSGGKTGGSGGRGRRRAQNICCLAMTASCLSCSAGMTQTAYCAINPNTAGCGNVVAPAPVNPPSGGGIGCCRAMTASCLSCAAGMTQTAYCAANPTTAGCGQQACCTANTASCMSCSAGMTEAAFCAMPKNLQIVGCGMNACCKALTLPCLSCQANMLPSDYCKANPTTVGCKSTGAGSGAQGRCYGPGQGGLTLSPTPAPTVEPCTLASKKKDCKNAKGKFKKSGGCFFTKSTKKCVDRDSLTTMACTDAHMQGKKECKLNSGCNYDKKAKTCSDPPQPTCADERNSRKCGKSALGCKYIAAGCCVDSGYTSSFCP